MAWIESHQSLEKHGKLLELCELLGIIKQQAIGHLHCLWWWAIDSAPTGDLSRYSVGTIAKAAGWTDYQAHQFELSRICSPADMFEAPGAGRFVAALIQTGWVDYENRVSDVPPTGAVEGDAHIHNWLDFCGDLIKKRLERRAEQKLQFSRGTKNVGKSPHGEISSPTQPNPTVPNPTVPVTDSPDLAGDAKSPENGSSKIFKPEDLMRLWNKLAHPALARVKLLPRTREAHIKARLKDFPSEQEWMEIINRVNESSFLTGQRTKWRAQFDWILNSQNLTKIMEGNYDDARTVRR